MRSVEVADGDVDHGYPIGVMQAQVKGAIGGEAIAGRHGERTGYALDSVLGMDGVWWRDGRAGGGPLAVSHGQTELLSLLLIAENEARGGAFNAQRGPSLGDVFPGQRDGEGHVAGVFLYLLA